MNLALITWSPPWGISTNWNSFTIASDKEPNPQWVKKHPTEGCARISSCCTQPPWITPLFSVLRSNPSGSASSMGLDSAGGFSEARNGNLCWWKTPFEGGAVMIGGSPGKKRGCEEGNAASGFGKQQDTEGGGVYPMPCPICGREFMSEKVFFGHMCSHPNRGLKGVHPPPAFNADEEFYDVPGLNRPELMEAAEGEGGVAAALAAETDKRREEERV